jgi:hypothetical protein
VLVCKVAPSNVLVKKIEKQYEVNAKRSMRHVIMSKWPAVKKE